MANERRYGKRPAPSACASAMAPLSLIAFPPHGAPSASVRSGGGSGCESSVPAKATQPSSPMELAFKSRVSSAGIPAEANAAASGRRPMQETRQKFNRRWISVLRHPDRNSPYARASSPGSAMRLVDRSSSCRCPKLASSICVRQRTPSSVKKFEERSSLVSGGRAGTALARAPAAPTSTPHPSVAACVATRRSSAWSRHRSRSSIARFDAINSPVDTMLESMRPSLARTCAISVLEGENSPMRAS
eukprot:scaffold291567_cov28-Tisochrysis_lutea.AAC.4